MKTKKIFRLLLLFSVLSIVGSGCQVFKRHHRANGELFSTKPHGRLSPGETDEMSGKENGIPAKKNEKALKRNNKSMKKDKKSGERIRK